MPPLWGYQLQLPDKKLLQARLHELLRGELPANNENYE